jgi:hypothetical protein
VTGGFASASAAVWIAAHSAGSEAIMVLGVGECSRNQTATQPGG